MFKCLLESLDYPKLGRFGAKVQWKKVRRNTNMTYLWCIMREILTCKKQRADVLILLKCHESFASRL